MNIWENRFFELGGWFAGRGWVYVCGFGVGGLACGPC